MNIEKWGICYLWPAAYSIHCHTHSASRLKPSMSGKLSRIGFYWTTFWVQNGTLFLLLSFRSFLIVPWHNFLLVPCGLGHISTETEAKTVDDKLLQGAVYSLSCFYSNSSQLFWSLTLKAQSAVDHYLAGVIASSLLPLFAQFGREIAIKGAQLFPVSNFFSRSYRSWNVDCPLQLLGMRDCVWKWIRQPGTYNQSILMTCTVETSDFWQSLMFSLCD